MAQVTNAVVADTSFANVQQKKVPQNIYQSLLDSNNFLNHQGKPQALSAPLKQRKENETFFYVLAGLLLFLGFFKTFFNKYFNTLFRVFFNTSLRQNQLTDQLEQATVPSLLLNIFFAISAALYSYFLLNTFQNTKSFSAFYFISTAFLIILGVYLVKYLSLLLTGWLTGYSAEVKVYIFTIFLLNKVIGLVLIPFTILIAFSTDNVAQIAAYTSIITVSILLLIRFFKAFGLLQSKVKLNVFHFLIYIIALEIVPIALIYKLVMIYFSKIT